MKVLNLYAGIGGNRKLWENVEVTAVELNSDIAKIYQDFFPDDKVIVADAHQYLLEHYKEFDFIWSSPPCPTHSRARFWGYSKTKPVYPDMKLYQEIIFLVHHSNTKWVVENVDPYYKPLINATKIGRHLFWSNFVIIPYGLTNNDIHSGSNSEIQDSIGFDIGKYNIQTEKYKGARARLELLRNTVIPELGLHIFNSMNNQELKLAL